jgi:hypothetical protein
MIKNVIVYAKQWYFESLLIYEAEKKQIYYYLNYIVFHL